MIVNQQTIDALLRRACKDDDPLALDLLARLALMVGAHYRGDRYGMALHHQKACELLDRYGEDKR
jgi:hypothetical protein